MSSIGRPLHEKTDAGKKISAAPSAEPAIDCNVLFGIGAIARWMGLTSGRVKQLIDAEIIPTFKPPGRSSRCALKSAINEAFAEYAGRPAARKSAA
jgi:ascorbate-specific PTS system EIIC-type component UlaA